jgi:hypothetical protein
VPVSQLPTVHGGGPRDLNEARDAIDARHLVPFSGQTPGEGPRSTRRVEHAGGSRGEADRHGTPDPLHDVLEQLIVRTKSADDCVVGKPITEGGYLIHGRQGGRDHHSTLFEGGLANDAGAHGNGRRRLAPLG